MNRRWNGGRRKWCWLLQHLCRKRFPPKKWRKCVAGQSDGIHARYTRSSVHSVRKFDAGEMQTEDKIIGRKKGSVFAESCICVHEAVYLTWIPKKDSHFKWVVTGAVYT